MAKNQEQRRKCSPKKQGLKIFFQAIYKRKNVFKIFFQAISKKKVYKKTFSGNLQKFNDTKNCAALKL